MDVSLRPMTANDAERSGQIIYEGIGSAYRDQGLLEPVADAVRAADLVRSYMELDPDGCLVADTDEQVVGVGFLHRRDAVASIGPLVIAPRFQGQGIGKRLLQRLIELGEECETIRGFADSFSSRAIGTVIAQGFGARDTGLQLVALGGLRGPGRLLGLSAPPSREITGGDLDELAVFDAATFGGSRRRDFEHLLDGGTGRVIREGDDVAGYLFGRVEESLGILGPGAAVSPEIMSTLMVLVGEQLEQHANILMTSLLASQHEVVGEALRMGFRGTSTSLYFCRGEQFPYTQPAVIGYPPDVV